MSEDVLEKLKERFKTCEDHYEDSYTRGEQDIEFAYGINQWDVDQQSIRKKQGRPYLTLNQMLPYLHQVVNDARQARPAIRVSPVDGSGDIETAEVMQGLIRNIERQSNANVAYDTAVLNSAAAGLGWIRVGTRYCDEMSFDQEPYVDRVLNFRSVYLDPESTGLAGEDAEYGFIFDRTPKDAFLEEYPEADVKSFEGHGNTWCDSDTITIVEYYYKEYSKRKIYKVKAVTEIGEKIAVVTEEEYEALSQLGQDTEILEERETEFPVIKYCKATGVEILEESEWIGRYIPLVPVYGDEVWLDGKREFRSLIRPAKDAQRMYNYWNTASTEFIALQQKAPWIGAKGSFDSYPDEWANANNENFSFLEYDVVYDEEGKRVEPPQKAPPITGSPAMMQMSVSARDDIRLALGMPAANMGQQDNAMSGIAIRNRQIEGDNANFHFMANLSASIAQVGNILVDLIPKLYSEPKIIRILGEDKKERARPINQPYIKQGLDYKPAKAGDRYDGIFDLRAGKYDVVCDVGASYSSKRQEAADKLSELISARPELAGVAGDLIMESIDVPMAKDIADRIRASMPPELLGDDPNIERLKAADQTIKQLQEQLLNLDAALQDKRKDEQFENAYKMQELELERQKAAVDAEKTRAEIAKIYADIGSEDIKGAVQAIGNAVQAITSQVQDVSDAMNIMFDAKENEATSEPMESVEELAEESENE